MNTKFFVGCILLIIFQTNLLIGQTNKDIFFEYIGKIKPRHAKEIQASKISIGAEHMDRDYTIYANWKEYLGPLGAKKARVQSGWAKCEKEKGIYNLSWLDEIIFDMTEQGVEPWINLSYGNPLYEGGGGWTLGQDFPTSGEALDAWEKFVKTLVTRYKDYVKEWEIWNEPHTNADFAKFVIITARAIKSLQPDAIVSATALGSGINYKFADRLFNEIEKQNSLHLINQIAYHRNIEIPENNVNEIKLDQVISKYSKRIVARQGEAGCPSEYSEEYALNKMDWTEIQQAKNTLRRLMCDLGRGRETSIFTIIDACNTRRGWNYKGLIASNPNRLDAKEAIKDSRNLTVSYLKPAYFAMQHVTSIFDFTLEPKPHFPYEASRDDNVYVFPHENIHSGKQAVAFWFGNKKSTVSTEKELIDFKFYNGNFENPVLVDLRTGEVFQLPNKNWSKKGIVFFFNEIPIYDSPMLLIDKSLLVLDL